MDASSLDMHQTEQRTCPEHGEYTSKLYIRFWSKCPVCLQLEQEARAQADEAQRKAERQARRQERIRRLRLNSGLIGRQLESTFDNFSVTSPAHGEVLDACRAFAEQFRMVEEPRGESDSQPKRKVLQVPSNSLWLIGPPGTGKSHLGAAMVNHLITNVVAEARMHSAREIVRLLRSTWNRDNPPRTPEHEDEHGYVEGRTITEEMMINELGEAPLLVLDEVGVTFGSDAEHVQLFDVLDLRYRLELPTVLLSNLKPTELKAALGERVFDRLREGAIVKTCVWPSHRGEPRRHGEPV